MATDEIFCTQQHSDHPLTDDKYIYIENFGVMKSFFWYDIHFCQYYLIHMFLIHIVYVILIYWYILVMLHLEILDQY